MRKEVAKPDQIIARVAGRQHGVIAFEQLVNAGLVPSAITRRVRSGRLHRLHRGVYAVGHTDLSREGRWLAAVLAHGDTAVLSHQSAAHLWGISPTSPAVIHITVHGTSGRKKRPGIRLHYSTTLSSNDVTRRWRIPVTTHARTLADLGYEREPTRSHLERLFLRLCRQHDISNPEVNVKVGPYVVDFLWRAARLIVEADSWAYHSNRTAFEADRARDVELQRLGFVVLRLTYRQVESDPASVAASVSARLRHL